MKKSAAKRAIPLLLALVFCLGMAVPAMAAEEEALPDWYFLFAVFKNVDADCADGKGRTTHTVYTMTQEEVDIIRDAARKFLTYLNQFDLMRAHVYVVEIDTPVTVLQESVYGSFVGAEQAASLLKDKADLDRYDHVISAVSLNVATTYAGMTSSAFANGTGHSCVNIRNQAYAMRYLTSPKTEDLTSISIHEFLHFMDRMSQKWGVGFDLHGLQDQIHTPAQDGYRGFYTDIILNRAGGDAGLGTGVAPAAWQYPPHVLRTMRTLTVPEGVAAIGDGAFQYRANLERVKLPSTVASIGNSAFEGCTALTEAAVPAGAVRIGDWAFAECTALARVSIPASITSIGYAAFWNTGLKEVYYAGTEDQWRAVQTGEYNAALTDARVYCNSLMADVGADDYCADPVIWAMETGIAVGASAAALPPNGASACARIVTFLYRALTR